MSESTLTFASTESFRNKLLAKNLAPYNIPGVYSPPVTNLTYETILSSYSTIDSPDELIAENPFANKLYPLNEFGPDGGYNLEITFNGPLVPVDPNQGPYYPLTNSPVVDNSNFYLNTSVFSPNQMNTYRPVDGYVLLYSIDDYENINKIFIPYWEPPSFIPSTYSPYEILISTNPSGSEGPLSQDSYMVRLAAESLRDAFQARISAEIFQNTIGQVNLQSLQDPFNASLLITGQQPLVYQNWRITVPENPVLRAVDLATRLASAYWPVSPIPGDYFDENPPNSQSPQTTNALNVVNQLTGGFLGPILNITRNPSEIFLANTGNAQRSSLFNNIDYNRYQPAYRQTLGGLLGVAQGIIDALIPGEQFGGSGYYVGSRNAEPGQITSPPNQVPVDAYGRQVNAPVYGPSELGILFEGNDEQINFGLKAKSFADTDNITGNFVWTSPKFKGAAGYHPTVGGGIGSKDDEFNVINADYSKAESTNIDFKKNSILDNTQRLIQSADNLQGIQKLKHVGNAINQVSKVFNDGYKEMTKGSQVLSYTDNTTGGEVGREYCRVFAKDTPYLTYADLQKTEGITKSNRRFTNSVLDNTYNLNIAPLRGSTEDRIGSTNLQKNAQGTVVAKKYMFSIENLAWRTSSRPGFTYDELPDCEKGPNGGRVMWFPPYDIKFSESSSANYQGQTFLGRPEQIYTYKDSSRTGQLSWKIIVDNPSVLNAIVEKQLKGQNKEKINSIIDSFFAGCVKYDIYELAKKFNTIPTKDLYTYQEIINNPRLTPEELQGVKKEIPIDVPVKPSETDYVDNKTTKLVDDPAAATFETKYLGFGFYFDNDIPGPSDKNVTTTTVDYESTYNTYVGKESEYKDKSSVTFNDFNSATTEFFNSIIKNNFELIKNQFIPDAKALLDKGSEITIDLVGSASATASVAYNKSLSERRIDCIINFLKASSLGPYIENQKFKWNKPNPTGEETSIPQTSLEPTTGSTTESVTDSGAQTQESINCTTDVKDKNNKVTENSQVFSVSAMACRRVRVSNISVKPGQVEVTVEPELPKEVKTNTNITQSGTTITEFPPRPEPTVSVVQKLKDGIGKQILRRLLSECDYFEVIQETNPFLYGTIKEKIKYFTPAFHSMTPEGLNSRLTFLNQCMRPGETIPTIGPDGTPIFDNARNTSFGAPPVLILRIGDFFHTKIIPTGLQLGYEPLVFDLNPEGIGVQPMIATVSLSFNIIGGMGLAKPVEQLQNALSFNYYGNTEIYDERAVPTEDTSALDKTLVNDTLTGEQSATPNQVQNQQPNDGGTTIGTIITNIPVVSGQTGEIGYKDIMDKLYDGAKGYFTTIINQLESVVKQNNYGTLMLLNHAKELNVEAVEQLYVKNGSEEHKIFLYGNPSKFEGLVTELFEKNIQAVSSNFNPIIKTFLSEYTYPGVTPDILKDNLKNYLKNNQNTFSTDLSTIIQEITIFEQDFFQIIRKVSLVSQSIDGKLLSGNVPRVYNISGTSEISTSSVPKPPNTLVELTNDFERFYTRADNFNTLCSEDYNIFTDQYNDGNFLSTRVSDNLNDEYDKYFYIIMSRILNDRSKKDEFIKQLLKGLEGDNQLRRRVERIVDDVGDRYKKQQRDDEKYISDFKKEKDYKNYVDGLEQIMYVKGKLRKCVYDTTPNSSEVANGELIRDLYLNPFKFK